MSKKLTAKKLDAMIERIYYATSRGVQISVMDIGKIYAAGKAAWAESGTEDAVYAAVVAKVAEVRVN